MKNLENNTILVTGASSGIGKSIAQTLHQQGATVILTGRNLHALQQTAQTLQGTETKIITADITQATELQELVNLLPILNGIVHSAGIVKQVPAKFNTHELLHTIMHTNFFSVALLISQLLKAKKIQKKASIVLISSVAAQHPLKGLSGYAASKAALEAYSKTLAIELAPQGIRCNCIAPAMVHTPIMQQTQSLVSEENMRQHLHQYPLGVGTPQDVAHAATFLISPQSSWITGTTLRLDGGLTAGIT